jgi:hypothetical protein
VLCRSAARLAQHPPTIRLTDNASDPSISDAPSNHQETTRNADEGTRSDQSQNGCWTLQLEDGGKNEQQNDRDNAAFTPACGYVNR